jgi:hypothetical protein
VSSHRTDSQTNNNNDELRTLRTRSERDHSENEKPRRLVRNSGEFEEYATALTIDPTTQKLITTTPVNSDLVTTMPTSTYNLQPQERERKLQDENNLLKRVRKQIKYLLKDSIFLFKIKENASLTSRLNEVNKYLFIKLRSFCFLLDF